MGLWIITGHDFSWIIMLSIESDSVRWHIEAIDHRGFCSTADGEHIELFSALIMKLAWLMNRAASTGPLKLIDLSSKCIFLNRLLMKRCMLCFSHTEIIIHIFIYFFIIDNPVWNGFKIYINVPNCNIAWQL